MKIIDGGGVKFWQKNRVDDGVTRRRLPIFKTQSNVAKPLTWNRTFKMNQSHLIILTKKPRRRRRNSTAHTSIQNTIECCKTTVQYTYHMMKKLPYCFKLKQLIKNWNHFLIDWGYTTSYLKTAHWSLTSFQTECVNTNSNLRFQVIFHLTCRA